MLARLAVSVTTRVQAARGHRKLRTASCMLLCAFDLLTAVVLVWAPQTAQAACHCMLATALAFVAWCGKVAPRARLPACCLVRNLLARLPAMRWAGAGDLG